MILFCIILVGFSIATLHYSTVHCALLSHSLLSSSAQQVYSRDLNILENVTVHGDSCGVPVLYVLDMIYIYCEHIYCYRICIR